MRKMKSVFIGILFISIVHISGAQENGSSSIDPKIPKLILRCNVGSLINPFKQAASITADYRVLPRLSVDAGLGYYFHAWYLILDQKEESYRGPQFRIGTKFYYRDKKVDTWYIGLEAKHDRITHQIWGILHRQGGQYSEVALIPRRVNTWTGAARFGRLIYLDGSKKWILDLYCGLGILQYRVKHEFPDDTEGFLSRRAFFNFIYPEGLTTLPTVIYGAHLGYAFW